MKRFAIKFPDGTYSKGPSGEHVKLEKAKLWTNIGHVKNHLNGLGRQTTTKWYKNAEVVEVEFVTTETQVATVADLLVEAQAREDVRKAESALITAEWELKRAVQAAGNVEHAKQKLERARKTAADLGIKVDG